VSDLRDHLAKSGGKSDVGIRWFLNSVLFIAQKKREQSYELDLKLKTDA